MDSLQLYQLQQVENAFTPRALQHMLAGIVPKDLNDISKEQRMKCLSPKTARLDGSLSVCIAHIWHQFRKIAGTNAVFPRPRPAFPVTRIRNEAEAVSFLHDSLIYPLVQTFVALASCADGLSVTEPDVDAQLLAALKDMANVTVVHQDTRKTLATPTHDETCTNAPALDVALLGSFVRSEPAFHELSSSLASFNNMDSSSGANDLYALPDDEAIEQIKAKYASPVPDLSLCWLGCRDSSEVQGGGSPS